MVSEGQVMAVLSKYHAGIAEERSRGLAGGGTFDDRPGRGPVGRGRGARDEAQRVAERTLKLREQGTAPQAQADTARANAVSANARVMVATEGLEAARAQLALAEGGWKNVDLMLSRTEVKAPVAGKSWHARPGSAPWQPRRGSRCSSSPATRRWKLRADVAETDLLRLSEASPPFCAPSAWPSH